ncbi:MAG: hypothetical protein IKB53_05940 [Oscillospiraceae bacterium]|nr:hypothetical protein [Oscillospiraceae bacterium]
MNTYHDSFPADWQRMDHMGQGTMPDMESEMKQTNERRIPMYPNQPMPRPMPQQPVPLPTPALPGSVQSDQLNMHSGLDLDALDGPFTNADLAKSSLKGLLMRNLGFYIVAGFLVGTQSPVSWEGILYSVGNDYIVIYQPDVDRYITGDLYSLKFVEFHNTKSSTPWAGYRRREGHGIW